MRKPLIKDNLAVMEAKTDGYMTSYINYHRDLGYQQEKLVPPVSTKELVDLYLDARRGFIADSSLRSYRFTLNRFAKLCPEMPITHGQIEEYLRQYDREKTSRKSVYLVLTLFFKFTKERHGFPNPMDGIKTPPILDRPVSAFNLEKAKKIIVAAGTLREKALVDLYLGHGFRCSEVIRIDITDLSDDRILIRGKERREYFPLLEETSYRLTQLCGDRKSGPVFLSRKGNRLSRIRVYSIIKTLLKKAGVTERKPMDSDLAVHALRRSFSTIAFDHGCEYKMVQRLLRHRTRDATDLYLKVGIDKLRAALEQYSPIRLAKKHNTHFVSLRREQAHSSHLSMLGFPQEPENPLAE